MKSISHNTKRPSYAHQLPCFPKRVGSLIVTLDLVIDSVPKRGRGRSALEWIAEIRRCGLRRLATIKDLAVRVGAYLDSEKIPHQVLGLRSNFFSLRATL